MNPLLRLKRLGPKPKCSVEPVGTEEALSPLDSPHRLKRGSEEDTEGAQRSTCCYSGVTVGVSCFRLGFVHLQLLTSVVFIT